MKNIAVIPARSGSKRLKDKNIKLLNGKPLIAYTIEAAVKAGIFDAVHLSTDSEEYAETGCKFGAEVPFLRSASNAADTSSSWDLVREVLDRYKENGKIFDTFMLLQPTSPLRESIDILNAYELMKEKNAKSIVSVCEAEHSPLWCNTLPENGSMCKFLNGDNFRTPSQKLEKYYRLNGAIYLADIPSFMQSNNIYSSECYAYIMESRNSMDIDSQLDFDIAEYLIQYKKI